MSFSLSVALGFLGWMSYIGLLLLRHHTQIGYTCPPEEDNLDAPFWSSDKAVRIIFSITAALMVFLLHGIGSQHLNHFKIIFGFYFYYQLYYSRSFMTGGEISD